MFNLLVSSDENDWNGDPFVQERSRCVSQYTEPESAARFGELNAEQDGRDEFRGDAFRRRDTQEPLRYMVDDRGEPGLGAGIYYSGQGVGNRNALNEMPRVGDEVGEMHLLATMGDWAGRMEDRLSQESAAEYLWQKLKGS